MMRADQADHIGFNISVAIFGEKLYTRNIDNYFKLKD